jgi:hypothetical protein
MAVHDKESKNRPALSVSHEVRIMLDGVRHPGQSYDGIIRELLLSWGKHQNADVLSAGLLEKKRSFENNEMGNAPIITDFRHD